MCACVYVFVRVHFTRLVHKQAGIIRKGVAWTARLPVQAFSNAVALADAFATVVDLLVTRFSVWRTTTFTLPFYGFP